jgi:hypothetical protein
VRAEALSHSCNAVHDDWEPVASRFVQKRGLRRYQKLRDIHVAQLSMPCRVSFLAQTSKAVILKHALGDLPKFWRGEFDAVARGIAKVD